MKRLRHILEVVPLYACLWCVRHTSFERVAWLARGLANLLFLVGRRRRRLACENVLRSGITSDPHTAAGIARASYRHFVLVVVESIKSGEYFNHAGDERRLTLDIDPAARAVLEEAGRGVILASGHFGNWEIAAQWLSNVKPVTGITRPMNNPYAERLVQRYKPRHRFTLTPKHDANTARFVQVLKRGEILAYMIDQHARDRGMMIDFFGRPASTHTAVALLHLVTGAPLCFGYCVRTGSMRFAIHALPPIEFARTGNKEADIRAILEALTRQLEDAIRQHPEQYLWGHRRWR